jgi:uncharacterized protein YoxC
MTNIDIIFLVIALAFVVLVGFLARLTYVATKTLKKVNITINLVQKQLANLGHEPRELIHNINDLSHDLNVKLKCLNPFFRSLSNLGEGLEKKTSSFKNKTFWKKQPSDGVNSEQNPEASKLADLVNWTLLGIKIWQQFKERREKV